MWQRLAIRHSREFIKHVAPAVIKPARTLWNEVIGFFFIVFAVTFGFKAFTFYRAYVAAAEADKGVAMGRLAVATFCTLLMACFGLASFLKARRIARS